MKKTYVAKNSLEELGSKKATALINSVYNNCTRDILITEHAPPKPLDEIFKVRFYSKPFRAGLMAVAALKPTEQ